LRVSLGYMTRILHCCLLYQTEKPTSANGLYNFFLQLARRQKENDAMELIKSFKAAAMRTFIDFIGDLRV